jgi:hypothetical protein
MFLRSIAFMFCEVIFGVLLMILFHHSVSGDLGYDRSAGNGEAQLVASGYSSLWNGTLGQSYPVNDEEVWLPGQPFHRLRHSQLGGFEDIDGVNHLGRNDANADSQSFLVNQVEQGFPSLGVQFLAVSN